MSATSRQPLSIVSACPRSGDLDDLGHARVALLLLVRGVGDRPRHGVVLLAGDDQQRPAIGILGVHLGLGPRIEVGRGRLEERRAGRRHRVRLVELLGLVLAHGVGEREAELLVGERDGAVAVGGVAEDRRADLSAEIGSGSTPRNGAGSIATDAAERPRPARICVSSPPKECPITAGFLSSSPITVAKWSATWPTVLWANTSGCAFASSTVSGSSGQPGVSVREAGLLEDGRPSGPSCWAAATGRG